MGDTVQIDDTEIVKVGHVRLMSIGGGLSSIGNKNCYLLTVTYEFEDENTETVGFCIDCGMSIPGGEDNLNKGPLDNKYFPDFWRIPDHVDRIEGVFISHAHRDHDGGTNKLIEFLMHADRFSDKPFPLFFMPEYATNMQQSREYRALTASPPRLEADYVISPQRIPDRDIFVDRDLRRSVKANEGWVFDIKDSTWTNLKNITALEASDVVFRFFKNNHSVADSMMILIEVAGKKILYSGDVRFHGANQTETAEFVSTLADPALQSVDLLLLDATGTDKKGKGKEEETVINNLLEIFDRHPGQRIFPVMFSSLPRVYETIKTLGRKGDTREILIFGGSMHDNLKWGHGDFPFDLKRKISKQDIEEMGISSDKKKQLIAQLPTRPGPGEWNPYSYGKNKVSDNAIIFSTGSQGEPLSALMRLVDPKYNSEMQDIHIGENDVVVFAARTIPGNEPQVKWLLNELCKIGCTIYYPLDHYGKAPKWARNAGGGNMIFEDLHVSGHAPQEDLQEIVNILKPAKLMPIHAPFGHRNKMADIMENPMDVLLPEDHEEIVLVGKGSLL